MQNLSSTENSRGRTNLLVFKIIKKKLNEKEVCYEFTYFL